jgi:homoserine dehydrogenase
VAPLRIALILVGFGHVGRRFVTLLQEMQPALAAIGVEPVIAGVTTARHGSVFSATGLDPARIADRLTGPGAGQASSAPFITDALARLRQADVEARVLVETTTLDVRTGQPAIDHVRAALAGGADVITANKGPVAFAYRGLSDEARRAGRAFLFEGAVMDGVPVFNLVRETMPGVAIRGFRGVVNSTTNFVLTALEQGEPFGDAVARMQEAGVAEADPSLDLDGWDAAAKAAALANVWLDADTTPLAVAREGISAATAARAIDARARGRRLKLVASGTGQGPEADIRVALVELASDDPLAMLDGQANAIEVDTWPLGRIVVTQRDGGLEKTAYALFADLMTLAQRAGIRSIDRSLQ